MAAAQAAVIDSGHSFEHTSADQNKPRSVDNNNNSPKINDTNMDNTNADDEDDIVLHNVYDDDEEKHDQLSEQRSLSDSDLESCDDFSADDGEDALKIENYLKNTESETVVAPRTNYEDDCKPGKLRTPAKKNGNESANRKDAKNNEILSTDQDSSNNQTTTSPTNENGATETSEFPELTEEDLLEKLQDNDVSGQADLIEKLKEINVTNLNKLQQMDRSDPAVKRLLVRPRMTSKEVKMTTIDADIKSMVNEFLRTNITGNFHISRVLRENYATFYSWLATHLQSERNAWAARLRQALEQMEKTRKDHMETDNVLKVSAARLRHLVQTASNIMYGIPDKSDKGKRDKCNTRVRYDASGRVNQRYGDRKQIRTKAASFSDKDSAYQTRQQNFYHRLSVLGRLNERPGEGDRLTQSSLNLVNVPASSRTAASYESDPGTYPSSQDVYRSGHNNIYKAPDSLSGLSNGAKNNNLGGKRSKSIENLHEASDKDDMDYTNGTFDGTDNFMDFDGDTDWKKVMQESIDVLMDVCNTLITDRSDCLNLMGIKPNDCASLADAVSNYAQDRHTSGHTRRKEIEKRLRVLELENRTLVEEMTTMQSTLADKNKDALNLQKQLDRLESLMHDNSVSKVHKCVGTEDTVVKLSTKPGPNKQSRSPYSERPGKSQLGKAKLSNSPYLNEKMTQEINGVHIVMPQRKRPGLEVLQDTKGKKTEDKSNDMPNGDSSSTRAMLDGNSQFDNSLSKPPGLLKEKSLIEISEEKLKTLKLRARKLEDSLHDAISSMERLNRSAPSDDNTSVTSAMSASTVASILSKSSRMSQLNRNQGRSWKTSSMQINGSLRGQVIPDLALGPEDSNDQHAPGLETEKSSMLSGRSVVLVSQVLSDRTPIPSSLRISVDKSHGPTPVPRLVQTNMSQYSSTGNHYQSENDNEKDDDDDDDDGNNITKSLKTSSLILSTSPTKKKQGAAGAPRLRHPGKGAKGVVSKCLRCQKLFNCVDNHKLACCYHTKDKERLEHYDPSGKLLKVLYAWKCCNQPQDSDGCCYGKHV